MVPLARKRHLLLMLNGLMNGFPTNQLVARYPSAMDSPKSLQHAAESVHLRGLHRFTKLSDGTERNACESSLFSARGMAGLVVENLTSYKNGQ